MPSGSSLAVAVRTALQQFHQRPANFTLAPVTVLQTAREGYPAFGQLFPNPQVPTGGQTVSPVFLRLQESLQGLSVPAQALDLLRQLDSTTLEALHVIYPTGTGK